MNVNELVTDSDLDIAWGNSDFGDTDKRKILANILLKCASGYSTGYTAKSIVIELGLVGKNWTLTKLGKQYLFAAYNDGISI